MQRGGRAGGRGRAGRSGGDDHRHGRGTRRSRRATRGRLAGPAARRPGRRAPALAAAELPGRRRGRPGRLRGGAGLGRAGGGGRSDRRRGRRRRARRHARDAVDGRARRAASVHPGGDPPALALGPPRPGHLPGLAGRRLAAARRLRGRAPGGDRGGRHLRGHGGHPPGGQPVAAALGARPGRAGGRPAPGRGRIRRDRGVRRRLRRRPARRLVRAARPRPCCACRHRPVRLAGAHLRQRGREAVADVPARARARPAGGRVDRGAGHSRRSGAAVPRAAARPRSAGLALAAALVIGRHHHAGMALAAGAVAAAAAWLLEAVAGHAHKIVPFIVWSVLRARGVRTVSGRPLGFADLYGHRAAAATYLLLTAGLAAACAGLAASWPAATAAAGGLLAVNLSVTPVRLLRAARAPRPGPAGPPPPAPARPGFPPAALPAAAIAISVAAAIMSAAALWPGRPAGGPAGRVAGGPVTTARVELGDMFVRPSSLTVRRGTRLVLHVVNTGALSHDLQLEGGAVGTGMLGPGQSRTADFGVVGRTEQAWCTVPGHKAAGMVLTIRAAAGARPAAGRARHPAPDAVISPGARPGPGWHPFGPALAPAPGGTVHRVTLIARDRVMQVAPGVRQDMWTFNGQVPGPTLRGHVGDLFIVTLVNRTSMDHSIDFHAASQPMEAMRTVGPGQSVTERFRVRYAGIFLYHCGTAPVLEHVANGMFGAMIIDPPRLARVAREFLIVQSELYLGPQGRPGDYAKMLRGQADAVVFNGYADQYLYSPLRVRAGQRVRIWVLDAGPSDDSAFHVVGAQFDTVFSNGGYLLRPGNPADGAAQTLNLMPGEGGFVEFTVAAPGRYEILDHHLDHAASGAAGWLVAGPA